MLQQYLYEHKLKVADLSKKSGIPYATLSELVRNIKQIDDCKVSTLAKLSSALSIDPVDLYHLCSRSYKDEMNGVFSKEKKFQFETAVNGIPVKVYKAAGEYTAEFLYDGKPTAIHVFYHMDDADYYIHDATEWAVEDFVKEKMFEGWI